MDLEKDERCLGAPLPIRELTCRKWACCHRIHHYEEGYSEGKINRSKEESQ